ncbi:hypothetical protein HIM_04951 [Hirsutella minnesotensis 3608]|uniref:Cyclin N-terminal domain-containing protein n=1 Tax=Hirsutella minnesotensis 3608 TaxID=1043627 RepID=A0A0F8A5R6_9HYPO|nr:hypothetical protein HIM_04951 [Hirsutella minnesotensis 3608]
MKCDAEDAPAFAASLPRHVLYNSSISSSASAFSTSVWSDTTSPDEVSTSANTSDSDSCGSLCQGRRAFRGIVDDGSAFPRPELRREPGPVAPELRANPRRTAAGAHSRLAAPPVLVRQSDRRINFVDSLVDSSTQIVEAIWPLSSVACRSEPGTKAVLPLRTFIQETLRRSRTSYSTLQVALYYLILIKPHVPKHNFTMEQPEDRPSDRALQCGRRMFLAALILASKYLQDRNYSARAWSKISGLNTQEINQNEIAFLLAVNWKLHIADDVFQRWTEIVLKCTPPPSPPSPGGAQALAYQTADWKQVILRLDPNLSNVEGLIPLPQAGPVKASDLSVLSPRSILNLPQDSHKPFSISKLVQAPAFMEPAPSSAFSTSRAPAPALGLLPTPRLTPQSSGLCTPAASATPQVFGKGGAMGLAMAQANCISSVQNLDRLPCSVTSSPQGYYPARRSSLANSVSTASSPESMVSDSSRSSRSSSFSSASSLASATLYTSSSRCSVPSRSRVARLWNDRICAKPTVPSVPEDNGECYLSSSPESYTGPVTKLGSLSLDTPLARRERELEDMARDAASDAARTLQDLHKHGYATDAMPTPKTGCKRSRAASNSDVTLQENVREILNGRRGTSSTAWPDTLVRTGDMRPEMGLQFPVRPLGGAGKRVCCSAEAASAYPPISLGGPGMWDGILN